MVRFKIESKCIFSTLKKLSIKDSLMGKILVDILYSKNKTPLLKSY